MNKDNQVSRKFNGKLNNFNNREEALFEQKHLKSYLQGKKFFTYGKNKDGTSRVYRTQFEETPTQKQIS